MGGQTFEAVAREYGLNAARLRRKAAREGWRNLRMAHADFLLQETMQQSVMDAAQELAILNCEDLQLAKELRAWLMKRVKDGSHKLETSDLHALALAAESIQRIGRLCLGADASNNVPIRPQEPELDLSRLDDAEFESFGELVKKCKKNDKKPPNGSVKVQ